MSTCTRTYAHAFQIWMTLVSLHLLCRSRKRNDMWVHPWNTHGRSSQLTSLHVERIWSTSAKKEWQPKFLVLSLVLPLERGGSSAVGCGRAGRHDHDQQHCYHHAPTVKPEAATAVVELLMMGMRKPKTCWAVLKRQVINLRNCCIWLVDLNSCVILCWRATRNIEHLIKERWTAVHVQIMSVRLLSLVFCRVNRGQDIYCIVVCLLKQSKYWTPQF